MMDMTLEKSRSTADHDFREYVRDLPCSICSSPPRNDGHHVLTRGRHGDMDEANIIPLCRICHTKVEQYGKARVEEMLRISLTAIARAVWVLYERGH